MNFQKLTSVFKKFHFKEILAVLFILVAVYFFRKERHELGSIIPALKKSNPYWIIIGAIITFIYILLQAGMYVYSFAAVRSKLPWVLAIELYLKRNFLSVFLPAGGVTALAYMPSNLRRSGIHKKEIQQSSGIYAFVGMLSLILVGVPVIIYMFSLSKHIDNVIPGLISIVLLLLTIFFIIYSFKTKGRLFLWAIKLFPSLKNKIADILSFMSNETTSRRLIALSRLSHRDIPNCLCPLRLRLSD